jgi:alkylresorcinol/alkylpyrone synthase
MSPRAALLSLATAVPPHILKQTDVAAAARKALEGQFGDFDRVAQVFETAGVIRRHAARPLDWYLEPHGWPDRTEVYLQTAGDLFEETARRALAQARLSGRDVDMVVTVSSTGIATPSLDARLLDRLGFRQDVARIPVFGLGCAAGVSGLALAARLAAGSPGAVVLFVAVELCTLAVRPDKLTAANVVSTALFADGAAALVLQAGAAGFATVAAAGDHIWRDTLDIMGWDVDPEGFGVVLARALPPFAETHLGPALASLLDRIAVAPSSIDRYVCHPGGPKIITALEQVLQLPQGSLDEERKVLATHGNMSAPTVLFVLERVLRAGLPERCLLIAMGPGFSLTCLSLERSP